MAISLVTSIPSKFVMVSAKSRYSLCVCLPKLVTRIQPRNLSVNAAISSLIPAMRNQNMSNELNITARCFSDLYSLSSHGDIQDRVMTVLKRNPKFDVEKFSRNSNFFVDVGLDSVEHLELVMGLEEEFGLEIPDNHGDRLLTPDMMVVYLTDLLESQKCDVSGDS